MAKYEAFLLNGQLHTGRSIPFASRYRDYAIEYNYEVPVGIDTWERGALLAPRHTSGRINQMLGFQRLFVGDYSSYFPDLTVEMNYHKDVAVFWSSLLMQYPPVLNESAQDMVSPRFWQSLVRALEDVIIDMIRFGTGLVQVVDGQYGAECLAPKPIYWMPDDEGHSALLEPSPIPGGDVTVWLSFADGSWGREVFKREGEQLGERIEADGGSWASADEWSRIGEAHLGRVGTLLNTALSPSTGDWGRSLYRDMTSMALEINRQLTQNSQVMVKHGKPRKIAVPQEGSFISPQITGGARADDSLLDHQTISDSLGEWWDEDLVALPGGIADLHDAYFEGSFDAAQFVIEKSQELLFAVTKIPEVWFKSGESGIIPSSGRALEFQFRPTYVQTQHLQGLLSDTLSKALYAAVLIEGGGESDLDELDGLARSEEGLFEWKNVFDQEDEVNTLVQGEQTEIETEGEARELVPSAGNRQSGDG